MGNGEALMSNPVFNLFISVLTFILGSLFSYVLYVKSLPKKRIWWDMRTIKLFNSYVKQLSKLRISYSSYDIAEAYSSRIIFWNSGNSVLAPGDIAKKKNIAIVAYNDALILDIKLLSRSNDTIQVSSIHDQYFSIIHFEYLERNHGGVIEIIHTGKPSDIAITGVIKGGSKQRKRIPPVDDLAPFIITLLMGKLKPRHQRTCLGVFAFSGLFLLSVFFMPLIIASLITWDLPDNELSLWVFGRVGIAILVYFIITITWLRTPNLPKGLDIFEEDPFSKRVIF